MVCVFQDVQYRE